jgi:pimeloyl-ACP methyl ester carboxylesterase
VKNQPPSRAIDSLPASLQAQILALNPEKVSAADVQDVLAKAPAPQVSWYPWGNLSGLPCHEILRLVPHRHGYPEVSIRRPSDGSYSVSCYENSEQIAGSLAWYYEKSGLRPMVVGHSQGGMQAMKVLHVLAGHGQTNVAVLECRDGQTRASFRDSRSDLPGGSAVVGSVSVSYASAVGAGDLPGFCPISGA